MFLFLILWLMKKRLSAKLSFCGKKCDRIVKKMRLFGTLTSKYTYQNYESNKMQKGVSTCGSQRIKANRKTTYFV